MRPFEQTCETLEELFVDWEMETFTDDLPEALTKLHALQTKMGGTITYGWDRDGGLQIYFKETEEFGISISVYPRGKSYHDYTEVCASIPGWNGIELYDNDDWLEVLKECAQEEIDKVNNDKLNKWMNLTRL